MSQIASAYIVNNEQISPIVRLAQQGKYEQFWSLLDSQATAVPAFQFSGYVIAVLVAYLDEQGCSLPFVDNTDLEFLSDDLGLVMAAGTADAASYEPELAKLKPTADELGEYFTDFTAEDWDEAGDAMLAGIKFLRTGLKLVQQHGGTLLLFIG